MDGLTRRRFWRVSVILAFVIGLGMPAISVSAQQPRTPRSATPAATPAAQSAVAPLTTAAVMPAGATVYVALNLDAGSAQLKKADELVRRAGLGDLLDRAIASAEANIQADTAMAVDLDALLGGEVGFAVTDLTALTAAQQVMGVTPEAPLASPVPASAAGGQSGMVVVLAPADIEAAADAMRQLSAQQAANLGVTATDTDYKGVTIHSIVVPDYPTGGSAYARVGDFIVVSATAADLEPVIDVQQGDAPALTDQAPFTQVRNELASDFLMFSYTNGPAYLDAMRADLQAAAAQLGPDFPFGVAFAQLNAYTGEVVWADDPGFRTDTVSIPVAGALPPAPANFALTLDAKVPDDTLIFADSFDLGPSLGPSLDVLNSVVKAVVADPELAQDVPSGMREALASGDIYAFLGRFLAFNPRTDLLDQLVGEWAFALSVRSLNPNDISGVFVSDAKNQTLLTDSVTKLAVWLNTLTIGAMISQSDGGSPSFNGGAFGAHTEEVDGTLTQVIEIPVPEMNTAVRLQWGVVNGQLVFGIGDGFTSYHAGPVATLADSPRYRSVMAELPSEHNGVFYLNLNEMINLVQPIVQQEIDAEQGGATPGASLPDLSGIQSFGMVSYERDGMRGTSSLLMISAPSL
ncbi:MAG TPA: DUF3352 domain-containing protein [Thermomicrobiales bacterium]|nr:DUF3352 domain-containing protein [Thermomicrobiales bacterium]